MRLVFTCHVRCIKRWKLNVGSSNPIWAHRVVPCLSFTLQIHKREACVRTAKVRQLYETMCVYTENLQTGSGRRVGTSLLRHFTFVTELTELHFSSVEGFETADLLSSYWKVSFLVECFPYYQVFFLSLLFVFFNASVLLFR